MKLSVTRTVEETVNIEVPDHFGYDSSPLGQVVDMILLHEGYYRTGVEDINFPRNLLHEDNVDRVENAVERLTKAYATAESIVSFLLAADKDDE